MAALPGLAIGLARQRAGHRSPCGQSNCLSRRTVSGLAPPAPAHPRGGSSQQPRAGVITEEFGIANISAERVHALVAAHGHHPEDRGTAPAARCQEAGAERMPANRLGSSPTRRALALTTLTTV